MRIRACLLAICVAVPLLAIVSPNPFCLSPKDAEAAVSIGVSVDELVASSAYVVVAKAVERQSAWEDLPGGRRIVTYTRLDVERTIAGEPGTTVWVRTLGGVVGEVGQWVSGEASIKPQTRGLFFLHKAGPTVVVTAMAQGHYPLKLDEAGVTRLAGSPDPGVLLSRRGPSVAARDVLVGVTLERALSVIEEARRAQQQRK